MLLEFKSFAKLNLYLNIIGKRADGYHLLDSLFALIDLHDVLRIERKGEGVKFNFTSPNNIDVPLADNIILKAVQLFCDKYNITDVGLEIHLTKNIPVGAGLGGGSSNAASSLLMLYELYQIEPIRADILEIALKLGADVPFFCAAKSAFVGGIGEIVDFTPDFETVPCVLIMPDMHVSTVEIYKNYNQAFSEAEDHFEEALSAQQMIDYLKDKHNDLEDIAIDLFPQIGDVLSHLVSQTKAQITRMSGSGSACFALFSTIEEQNEAYELLRNNKQNWRIVKTLVVSDIGN
jgi:4-diphosphocytidyl-2-C-methyl-D-erythritol kinase